MRLRQLGVAKKFGVLSDNFKGKRVVIIDDSIVRGNTISPIIKLLRESGAKEVSSCLVCTVQIYIQDWWEGKALGFDFICTMHFSITYKCKCAKNKQTNKENAGVCFCHGGLKSFFSFFGFDFWEIKGRGTCLHL